MFYSVLSFFFKRIGSEVLTQDRWVPVDVSVVLLGDLDRNLYDNFVFLKPFRKRETSFGVCISYNIIESKFFYGKTTTFRLVFDSKKEK